MNRRSPAIEVLLIDGNNLLHRTGRQRRPRARCAALLPDYRGAIPRTSLPTVSCSTATRRAGTDRVQRDPARPRDPATPARSSADDALLNIVRDTAARTTARLVTDDRGAALTEARHLGARTERLDWLEALLGQRRAAVVERGIGRRASPRANDRAEREPWTPGRGATKQRQRAQAKR